MDIHYIIVKSPMFRITSYEIKYGRSPVITGDYMHFFWI